jgi:hypothetical protein
VDRDDKEVIISLASYRSFVVEKYGVFVAALMKSINDTPKPSRERQRDVHLFSQRGCVVDGFHERSNKNSVLFNNKGSVTCQRHDDLEVLFVISIHLLLATGAAI